MCRWSKGSSWDTLVEGIHGYSGIHCHLRCVLVDCGKALRAGSIKGKMDHAAFENIVESVFHRLPAKFKEAIENVGVFIEEYPSDELVKMLHLPSKHHLLGLYQGVPLTKRGSWYGMSPITPDKISLYKNNIEASCRTEAEIEDKIYEVLVHEIGHYFGMNEEEIRAAGY